MLEKKPHKFPVSVMRSEKKVLARPKLRFELNPVNQIGPLEFRPDTLNDVC
jgi:hypothetical protein